MSLNFSWFPGHMQSTLRELAREEKMASMALVVLDSRCPRSSRNPKLEQIFSRKPVLYVLNKSDLSSVRITGQWLDHFKQEDREALALSCRSNAGRKKLLKTIKSRQAVYEKQQKKRGRGANFRLVVVGVPNTGKSSIINLLSPGRSVKTGKKPGLTRGRQWLKVSGGIEVLDSPGVMVPRMDLKDTSWILGTVGAIRQDILPLEEVAGKLINYLRDRGLLPGEFFPEAGEVPTIELLGRLAKARGYLQTGGELDTAKAALQLLVMFREGRLGRISLEEPGDLNDTGVTDDSIETCDDGEG